MAMSGAAPSPDAKDGDDHRHGDQDDELRFLRRVFDELDRNKSGGIDGQEIKAALQRLKLPAGPADVAAVIAVTDRDRDGEISFQELVDYVRSRRDAARETFQQLDRNGSGRLEADDLAVALARIAVAAAAAAAAASKGGPAPPPAQAELLVTVTDEDRMAAHELVRLLDRDGDGSVDFHEFLAATALLPRVATDVFVKQWYDNALLDSGDGAILRVPSASPTATPLPASTAGGAAGQVGPRAAPAAAAAVSLVCGAVAGAVSRTATAPFDRIKILLQVASPSTATAKVSSGGGGGSGGIVATVRRVLAEGGPRAFFRGNGVNVLKVMPEYGLRFACFVGFRNAFFADPLAPTGLERFVAGGMAGVVSQSLVYPLDVVKTRLAASRPGEYRGIADCFRRTVRHGGRMGALYRGLAPTLLGSFPCAAIDLALLSFLKDTWIARATARATARREPVPRPSQGWLLTFAAISSSVASICTYPLNLVRTRMQAQGLRQLGAGGVPQYAGMADCFRRTWADGGLRAFYVGLGPNLLKSLPSGVISYVVYETCRRAVEDSLHTRR